MSYWPRALSQTSRFEAGYAAAESCAGCHRKIWESYGETGMGRSFSPATAVRVGKLQGAYFHQPSDSYFQIIERDGAFLQRRYQLTPAGAETNVMEKRIDFVMGSGNHSRAYLHRTERGQLVELPLAWYAEKGGYWAMNPGYDRPNHDGFRRPITYDCMFCHNGYPQIPAGHDQAFAAPVYAGALPEGIDCQRCHGPGARHVQLAKSGGAAQAVRGAIVNPARLSGQRQMEVCMACHLESTSFPLPNVIERYDRGAFSFRPGEALGDFMLNFDHAPGTGHDDKFELVNAAYRLRRSACFLKSDGKLLCTTCHNPHEAPRGEAASRHYTAVCRQCHSGSFDRVVAAGKHTKDAACVDCHMPKRRTEDVVHVVATDHYIQRRKPAGDLLSDLAERQESYRGPVVLYYPEKLAPTTENELYLAVAQVNQRSNLAAGITRLSSLLAEHPEQRAEFYFALAEAWRDSGEPGKAIAVYREAIRRNPKFALALQKLGAVLRRSGRPAEAVESLKQATALDPDNAVAWHELGLTYRAQGETAQATSALERAIALDPDLAEAHNNLGIIRLAAGDGARAAESFREAIRIQPDYADAHGNLANLLSQMGRFGEAREQFEMALRLRPGDAATRYNFAMALGRSRQYDEAQRELEEALRSDPQMTDAHLLLGDLLMAKGDAQGALPHYREAVRLRPESGRGHLGLGLAMATAGDTAGAAGELQKAAGDSDAGVREEALRALRQLGR